jgi:hypothetical protein
MISNTLNHYIDIDANANFKENNNTIAQSLFPAEVWCHIVSFCDVKTALSISSLCKYIHFAIKKELPKKFYCKRVPNNCDAYSIKNYKEFIAPMLENLDAKTKNTIDLHLDNLKNIKITPAVENEFSAFLFSKLANTARIIPIFTSIINELELNQVEDCIADFSINCCAIRFQASQNKIHIYQFNFQANIDLLEIISPVRANQRIIEIQFTDENNLLVLIGNDIERNLTLALFELNLDNTFETSKVNNLWHYTINNFGILYHTKAAILPNSNDKKIILIKYNSEDNQETLLLTIQDSNYTIQKYNFYNIKQTPFSQVNEIIFCNNNLDLALITKSRHNNKELHLLARNNNKSNFMEQKLPIQEYFYLYEYHTDLQFNKSGSICIYINHPGAGEIVLLNKIAGKWYLAMYLKDSRYYGLRLTLDEKNIFVIRSYKDCYGDDRKNNLEVMPIEDKILTSALAPLYTRKRKPSNNSTIRYKNFHPLVKDIDKRITKFTIHPSGLAVFACKNRSNNTTINIIYPKKPTRSEAVKHLGSKVAYYTKKVFYD